MGELKHNNLDQLAAQTAQNIIAETKGRAENLITKALGVLQENGVYAFVLFLLSRTSDEKKMAEGIVVPQLAKLLSRPELVSLPVQYEGSITFAGTKDRSATTEFLKHVSDKVCADLDKLLLVKDLYEQTLIYARYGAKAAAKEDD